MAITKKTEKTTDVDSGIAIPSIIPDKKPSAASLLANLSGKTKTTPKPAAKKSDHPTMALDAETSRLYALFAPAKQLADIFTAKVNALKDELNDQLFDTWVGVFWKNKTQPQSQSIKAIGEEGDVCSGSYVVTERIKLQVPKPDDPVESTIELLVDLGLQEVDARKAIENEVDFTPQLGLRPFNELVTGHYEDKQFIEATEAEQAVGQKILEFVSTLSEEEQELVLRNAPKTTIKKGILARLCQYAHSKEQLASLLKVFVPVPQNRNAKFATTATPVERTKRLLDFSTKILGDVDEIDDDEDDEDE